MPPEGRKVAVVGAGAYVAGPLLRGLQKQGYLTVGIARPSTDLTAIDEFCSEIHRGDLTDFAFVQQATAGCSAIINVVNQLNPPCETVAAQLENDVPILEACLFAGLKVGAQVIHTSGNFSIPSKGKSGGIDGRDAIFPPLPSGPFLDHWPNFEHIPEMQGVATLAEAKCRTDLVLHNFVHAHPKANASIIIPAATYGPSIGGRLSFWDRAVEWYQVGHFQDFMTGKVHLFPQSCNGASGPSSAWVMYH